MKNILMQFFSDLIRRINYYVSFLRVYNTRNMIVFYLIGRRLNGDLRFDRDMLIIPLIFITSYGYISVLNFIFDLQTDRLNKRYNPLLNNQINLETLKIFSLILSGVGFIFSLLSTKPFYTFITTFILIFLGYIYSTPPAKLSHHPVGKIAAMVFIYLIIPVITGIKVNFTRQIFLIISPLIIYYASFLLYSDIKDMKGDKISGKRTVVVALGLRKTLCLASLVGILSSIALLMVLGQSVSYPNVFVLLILILSLLQIVAAIKPHVVRKKIYGMFIGYMLMALSVFLILFEKQ